ncbi:Butyrophilin-like protein 10 [Manis javanica]|nr:Butyrophilin-like protein 10 [Manis javanica]
MHDCVGLQQPRQARRAASHVRPAGVELIRQGDLFEGEAPEPHCTFVENALSKAPLRGRAHGPARHCRRRRYVRLGHRGLPGVDTAHYCTQFGREKRRQQRARPAGADAGRGRPPRAAMVSNLVGVRSARDPEPLITAGPCSARSLTERRGTQGFGFFDPVMYIPELARPLPRWTRP